MLDLLVPVERSSGDTTNTQRPESATRDKFKLMLRAGELQRSRSSIDTKDKPQAVFEVFAVPGMEEMDNNLRDMLGNMLPKKSKRRKVKVKDALKILERGSRSISRRHGASDSAGYPIGGTTRHHILDKLDALPKAAKAQQYRMGGVSREGVQRDLLPSWKAATSRPSMGS
jgi:ATP-dependent HslUV protease ATP-binding subunit HslU